VTNTAYALLTSVSGQAPAIPLSDSFGGSEINTALWNASISGTGASASESDGTLDLATSSGDIGDPAVYSNDTYDLTGSCVTVQVVSPGGGSGTSGAQLYLTPIGTGIPDQMTGFRVDDGIVYAQWRPVDGGADVWSAAWSSSYAWWRIRESGGTVYWDTSPDGVTWTNRASIADTTAFPGGITALYVVFSNNNYAANTGCAAKFSNFNVLPSWPGFVQVSAVVLSPAGVVFSELSAQASFNYGDTAQDVLDAAEATLRTAASDPNLHVEFIN
jgi:hypothetical protein